MNLGIEDAWILAGMIKTNKTDEYTKLRLENSIKNKL